MTCRWHAQALSKETHEYWHLQTKLPSPAIQPYRNGEYTACSWSQYHDSKSQKHYFDLHWCPYDILLIPIYLSWVGELELLTAGALIFMFLGTFEMWAKGRPHRRRKTTRVMQNNMWRFIKYGVSKTNLCSQIIVITRKLVSTNNVTLPMMT